MDLVCSGLASRTFWRENLGPQLREYAARFSGQGRVPTKLQPYGSKPDKLGTLPRSQDGPGKTNTGMRVPSLDDVLPCTKPDAAPWGVAKREATQPIESTPSRVKYLG